MIAEILFNFIVSSPITLCEWPVLFRCQYCMQKQGETLTKISYIMLSYLTTVLHYTNSALKRSKT